MQNEGPHLLCFLPGYLTLQKIAQEMMLVQKVTRGYHTQLTPVLLKVKHTSKGYAAVVRMPVFSLPICFGSFPSKYWLFLFCFQEQLKDVWGLFLRWIPKLKRNTNYSEISGRELKSAVYVSVHQSSCFYRS